ncbi:MAG: phosphatase PAP2 family protein [Anaerolineales bacterium]
MEYLTQLSIPVSIWFQNSPDWLVSIMKVISFMGDTEFYLLIMPLLYWCIDTTLGIRIGIILLVSGGLNNLLKFSFASPRPFWVSSKVKGIVEATGFGFPSGHSQNAASIWGLFATSTRKTWLKGIAITLIILIGFSRIVLGVHFTHDVLMGWLVGLILLFTFIKLEDRVTAWFKGNSIGMQILALVLATSLLIIPAFLIVNPLNPPPLPTDWLPEGNPYNFKNLFTTTGALFGLGLGVIFIHQSKVFTAEGPIWKRILRYPVGLIGVLVLYLGLGSIFPDDVSLVSFALRFTRYFLIGFWISYGAPQLFTRLKLSTLKAN